MRQRYIKAVPSDPTTVLTQLADALRQVATKRSLVLATSDVLAGFVRLGAIELWTRDRTSDPWLMTRTVDGVADEEGGIENPPGAVVAALADPSRATTIPPDARSSTRGTRRIVALPLCVEPPAVALLQLRVARAPTLPWDVIGRILALGLAHAATLARFATGTRQATAEHRRLRDEVEGPKVIAHSPAMREALTRLDLVAGHDTTTLIQGESGTGKELCARRIHARSPRRRAPFVAVNCGALPEQLVESELFGHEPGAFTGARGKHKGRFERAHGGTLFLDEVAELPLPQQVKLLRALQEGEIERLGGNAPVAVDVRVIAATHRDLTSLVEQGEFREDLLWRLDVFRVAIPPLRERIEDLPFLVRSLLAELVREGTPSTPATDDLDRLARHNWPGNVRELRSVVEEALILGSPTRLAVAEALESRRGRPQPASSVETSKPCVQTFDEASRACIRAALSASEGKIYGTGGAATRLGLHPSTLHSKLRRLGMR